MISTRRLVEKGKKWQKMAAQGRKRISPGGFQKRKDKIKETTVTEKGHFGAYAADGKRYMLPLDYLRNPIFQELLQMTEEEFRLNIDGAIIFPYDSARMHCHVTFTQEYGNPNGKCRASIFERQ